MLGYPELGSFILFWGREDPVRSQLYFPMLPSRKFIILSFTFKSIINLELTFCVWYKAEINLPLIPYGYIDQPSIIYGKKPTFSILLWWYLCCKSHVINQLCGFVWTSYCVPFFYLCLMIFLIFNSNIMVFDSIKSLTVFFFIKIGLAVLGPLHFSYKFKHTRPLTSWKKCQVLTEILSDLSITLKHLHKTQHFS